MPAFTEQPGRSVVTDSNGKVTTTITFVGDTEAPTPSISGKLISKTTTKEVAGKTRTQFVFEKDPFDSPEGASFEFISSLRSVPIETHPNYAEKFITAEEKKKIKDAINVPDRSPDFEDFTDRKRAISLYGYLIDGVTSYYVPSMIVRKTYQASEPPYGARQIGKIRDIGIPIAGLPKKANFLLINVTAVKGVGKLFTITEEYEMSGEGGWDTWLYG